MNNILVYLLNNRTEKFTINQISKNLNINYRIAHTQIKSLESQGLIKTESVGRSLLCSLTGKFNENIFTAELIRQNLMSSDILQVRARFLNAKQNFVLLLFGSYAKNKATRNSDIDLLAITENKLEIEEMASLIPKKIHLTTVNYNEFLRERDSRKFSVVSECLKGNVILIGIEDYYRLLNNDI
ncbi:nucleotidyltransferase domain-containing protein [Candidatus Woesearchaeota archaeon]|nr:nucleotidyltransferase domain-containing protein [Candidatus Woesearchaeota archaeon]